MQSCKSLSRYVSCFDHEWLLLWLSYQIQHDDFVLIDVVCVTGFGLKVANYPPQYTVIILYMYIRFS